MEKTPQPPPRYKKKNVISFIAIVVLFFTLTYVQTTLIKLKGSLILFHALVNFTLILLLLVVVMIIRYLIRAWFEPPISRFRQKLVIAFMISTLFPAAMLFMVSTNFIQNTLDRWLNPIHGPGDPLEDAMSIVRFLHTYYQERGAWFGNQLARAIEEKDLLDYDRRTRLEAFLREKQIEYNLGMIQVFDDQGTELSRAINENIPIGESVTTPSATLSAALQGEFAPPQVITAGGGTLYRNFIPMKRSDDTILGVLVINFFSTERLEPKLNSIQRSFEAWHQQLRMQQPIKQEYMYLFLIPTLLILFFAIWFGFYLAKGVTLPIQKLAEGTHAIMTGNLDFELDVQAHDEIGTLVESFERMRLELKKNQSVLKSQTEELQAVNLELDRKQHYVSSLLESLTTGVIAMDSDGQVLSVNPAAQTMLQIEPQFMIGKKYQEAFNAENLQHMKKMIERCFTSGVPILNREIYFFSKRIPQHLSISIAVNREPEGEILGLALVCEDLSELIKIQKAAAWSEVARRIAHEIKNPLTPIRLSAQRVNRKLKRQDIDDPVYSDCCKTIIREVDTIQRLVDSFSRFAKMPEAKPVPTNFHDFLETIMEGYSQLHARVKIIRDFTDTVITVNIDTNLMKQALTNIIDNAVDAMGKRGTLEFHTTIDSFLNIVRLEIGDTGPGIPEEDKEKLFMPYFSTKKRGTGLGLAIVARIIGDHYGYVSVTDNQPQGTRIIIELPVMQNPVV